MPLCVRQWPPMALRRPGATLLPLFRPIAALFRRSSYSPHGDSTLRSRRSFKRHRNSPSNALLCPLQDHSQHHALPPSARKGKIDLSYASARKLGRRRLLLLQKDARHGNQLEPSAKPPILSLQTITAILIKKRLSSPSSSIGDHENDGSNTFTGRELSFLKSKSYTVEDVNNWVSIIIDKDAKRAAEALYESNHSPSQSTPTRPSSRKPIPPFVLLFFLRRPLYASNPEMLRFVLMHAWHQIQRKRIRQMHERGLAIDKEDLESCQLQYPTMDDSSVMIMIVRLLRHARHVWPESLVSVSHMFTENFSLANSIHQEESAELDGKGKNARLARLTMLYNRVLKLIASPSSMSPYLSVPYLQRAQFDILRKMADHKPRITISREGYRAVIAVNLASRKNDQDHEWDQLKARSWPPWKEERTGLDAEKGREYGSSTALRGLNHASEAGYAPAAWESVAHILSGWDLDGSPTIQTRAMMLHKRLSGRALLKQTENLGKAGSSSPGLWAARIKATRTAQEAWACFLTYSDMLSKLDHHSKPSAQVYQAMLEKLAADPLRSPKGSSDNSDGSMRRLSAGDGKEVFPTPESPKEATYVRTEPPTLDELGSEMVLQGVIPNHRATALLISKSSTLGEALKYLRWAEMRASEIGSLISRNPEKREDLRAVHPAIFTAFVRSLCSTSNLKSTFHPAKADGNEVWRGESPLTFVHRLLRAYRPTNRVPYHSVLGALTHNERFTGSDEDRLTVAKLALEKYSVMCKIMEDMHSFGLGTDAETFRIRCHGLEAAISAALEISENPLARTSTRTRLPLSGAQPKDDANVQSSVISAAHDILNSSDKNLRFLFTNLMNGAMAHESRRDSGAPKSTTTPTGASTNQTLPIPRLLTTPWPILFHQYTRVLGLLRDYSGLLEMLQWMSTYQDEIQTAAKEPRGGSRMLRRSLIALRVFVERVWVDPEDNDDGDGSGAIGSRDEPRVLSALAAPAQMRAEMQGIVESLGWGGWPSDEEVESYVKRGEFPRGRA